MKLCGVTTVDQLHVGYLSTLEVEHEISTVAGTKDLKSRF